MKKVLLFVSAIVAVFCMSLSANAEDLHLLNGQVYTISTETTGYFISPADGETQIWASDTEWYSDAEMKTPIELTYVGYKAMPNGVSGAMSKITLTKGQKIYFLCSPWWGISVCAYNEAAEIGASGEDVETGVNAISVNAANAPVYNLNGVKVGNDLQALPAGLYIVNGKKVVVK